MATGMDVGIDLGTATILVYLDGEIVLKEPSVVAIHTRDNSVLAVGEEAYNMLGRTPDTIRAERPMAGGVIAGYELTERMIRRIVAAGKTAGYYVGTPEAARQAEEWGARYLVTAVNQYRVSGGRSFLSQVRGGGAVAASSAY